MIGISRGHRDPSIPVVSVMIVRVVVALLLMVWSGVAWGQPVPARGCPPSSLAGCTFSGPVNAPSIGATTPGAGAFTGLTASGAVSGAGFAALLTPYAPLASPTFTGTVNGAALNFSGTATIGTNGSDAIDFKDTVGVGPKFTTSGNNLQIKTGIAGGGSAIVVTIPSQIASAAAASITLPITNVGGLLTFTGNTAYAGTYARMFLDASHNATGTFAGPAGDYALNQIAVTDTVTDTTGTGERFLFESLYTAGVGSTRAYGAFKAAYSDAGLTGDANNSGLAGYFLANGTNNQGGTSGTQIGQRWGINIATNISGTYFYASRGMEINQAVLTGGSVLLQEGIKITKQNSDRVAALGASVGILLGVGGASSTIWTHGIEFGSPVAVQDAYFPFDSTSIAIDFQRGSSASATVGTVLNVASNVTVSGYLINAPGAGFTVDGSGNMAATSYKVGATAGADCTLTTVSHLTIVKGIATLCN